MYLAKGVDRFAYKTGFQPKTGVSSDWDITFNSKTLDDLIQQIKECHDDTEDVELYNGVLSVKAREVIIGGWGYNASEEDLALWEKGKLEIYACVYRYNIFKKLD